MCSSRAVVAVVLAVLLAACGGETCLRNSDCPPSFTCSPAGVCGDGLVAIDAGDVDAGDVDAVAADAVSADAVSADAAIDAAAPSPDAIPPILDDPGTETGPPIVTAYDAGTDAPPLSDPILDPTGAETAPDLLAP